MRSHDNTREEPTATPNSNATIIRSYLAALEAGALREDLARFFTSDAEQVELPNRLNPSGGKSDLPTVLRRAEQGKQLLQRQSYEVRSMLELGNHIAVEARWSAVLAVPLGTLAAGSTMSAHFAMFFEMRDGRICLQRNYDCFEPW
jgi:ketosteroid isomerase-like protein